MPAQSGGLASSGVDPHGEVIRFVAHICAYDDIEKQFPAAVPQVVGGHSILLILSVVLPLGHNVKSRNPRNGLSLPVAYSQPQLLLGEEQPSLSFCIPNEIDVSGIETAYLKESSFLIWSLQVISKAGIVKEIALAVQLFSKQPVQKVAGVVALPPSTPQAPAHLG
tara:strand:+ start:74 stop:571 length:498 start_codon:yes stop_codon:yes gene_type:complete